MNGELSSVDMARIINVLSVKELMECELACNRSSKDKKDLNLGMWW